MAQGKKLTLQRRALAALAGVGDRKYEWHEWTGRAYHIRRRLTPAEQQAVGEVVDLRGTDEGWQRFRAIEQSLPPVVVILAHQELREEQGQVP